MFLNDGRVEMDINVVERTIRPHTLTRKNALFAGSDGGAKHWALTMALIQMAKLNEVNPLGWYRFRREPATYSNLRIRQILQPHFGAQASARAIAVELGVARSTVQGYLAPDSSADLGWPPPVDLTDAMLEERVFPPAKLTPFVRRYVEPDWASSAR